MRFLVNRIHRWIDWYLGFRLNRSQWLGCKRPLRLTIETLETRRLFASLPYSAGDRSSEAIDPTSIEQTDIRLFNNGSISGTVWNDTDGDGTLDVGESTLPGRRVYLDQNRNGKFDLGETNVMTSITGQYTLSGLVAGNYLVAIEKPTGTFQSQPINSVVPPDPIDPNGWRVRKAGQVNLAQFNAFGGTLPSASANDIISYVSPSGNEYAIIGLERGVGFVRVSNPDNPVIVAVKPGLDEGGGGSLSSGSTSPNAGDSMDLHEDTDHPDKQGSIWRDMKVFGQYAYAITESTVGRGVQVFNLSQIDAGIVTDVTPATQVGPNTSHTLSVNPASGYLFLSGSSNSNGFSSSGGLVAINVNNPSSPVTNPAWKWDGHYIHDVVVLTYNSGPFAGREIAFAFGTNVGVYIIDVTDKANMFTVSVASYPNVRYAHDGTLSEDLKYLFVNDELDEYYGAVPSTTTHVLNVADIANPFFVTAFTNGLGAIDHNPMVRGNFIFEANYRSGLRIYDISEIGNIAESGYYDTYPANDGSGFNGAWGVDSSLPSRTVIISDIESGLFVLDSSHATVPRGEYLFELTANATVSNVDFGLVFAANMTTLNVAGTDAEKSEGDAGQTVFTFTVSRTGVTNVNSSVAYAIAGSGLHPANALDFIGDILPSGNLSFAPGESSKSISIPVKGEKLLEPHEGFNVILSGVNTQATIGNGVAAGVIRNEDLNRQIFYNRSTSPVFGDGSGNPVNAIDTTKVPLQNGITGSYANVTNYERGLNGLILDLPDAVAIPSNSDIQFATWNGIDAAGFIPTVAVPILSLIVSGGEAGSNRFKIEFADYAIQNTWLRVTVVANASTGLFANDVFYFGNTIGDMQVGNLGLPIEVRTNATDTSAVRQNQSPTSNSVSISNLYDVNKDGRVNATDTAIVRQNQSSLLLRFFDPLANFGEASFSDLTLQAIDFDHEQVGVILKRNIPGKLRRNF